MMVTRTWLSVRWGKAVLSRLATKSCTYVMLTYAAVAPAARVGVWGLRDTVTLFVSTRVSM